MNRRGFSLMEILTVMIMIGIMASLALPRLNSTLAKQSVRGARSAITTAHSRARNAAISRGRRTAFAIRNGVLVILSRNPVTGVVDTVGRTSDSVTSRFGVTFTVNPSTRDTLVFDSRGLGTEGSGTDIYVSKSGYADTVSISSLGRVLH